MILNRIRLENFVSHKSTELKLGYGINVVVGPNGAGKTSILDGISFALFNDSGRGRKENLINNRAKSCKVGLAFTEGGIDYEVEWTMERNGSARGSLFRMFDGKKQLQVRGGERSVVPDIQNVLGIDKNMFLQSVYVRQGEIEKLVTARAGDRKELISRLLGIEELEKAWSGMKMVVRSYENKQLALNTELQRKPVVEEQKAEVEAKLKELNKQVEAQREELAELEAVLKNLETNLAEMDAKKKSFDQLEKEKARIEEKLKSLEGKVEREKQELDLAISAAETVSKLSDDVDKLPFLESYVSDIAEKKNLELRLEAIQEKLDSIIRLKRTLKESKEGHELYLEKEKQESEKNKERKQYEGSDAALSKAEMQLEKCEKEANKKKSDLTAVLQKCSALFGEPVSVDNFMEILEKVKSEFGTETKNADAKVTTIISSIKVLEERIKEVEENLAKFSSITEVKACPTCDTELPPERISHLVEKYSSGKIEATKKMISLEGELLEAKKQRNLVYEHKEAIDSISSEMLGNLSTDLSELEKNVAEEKLEVIRLQKQEKILKTIDEDLEKIQSEIALYEETHQEFQLAKKQLDNLPSEENIKIEKKPLVTKLEELDSRLKILVEQLGYVPESPQEDLGRLRDKKGEYDRNISIAKRISEYEAAVAATNKELKSCRDVHSNTVQAIDTLGYREETHTTEKEHYKEKDKEVKDLAGLTIATEQNRNYAIEQVNKCKDELKTLATKAAEKKLVDRYISLLGKVRDAFGKDGIQKIIRARARPLLEKVTRDLFERFNLAYSDIKVDDDYNISVIGPSGEQNIDQISGGERVALAIALRLAVAQVLSGRIETVIMDEPTTHLDEDRRKELVNILNSFFREGGRIIPQMLIITHHNEIEEVADVVYSVKKKDGYSTIESEKLITTH